MDADAPAATPCMKPATAAHSLPPPLPPAPFAVRAGSRSRVTELGAGAAFSCPPDTPPRCSFVTVPFLWEEAPGKPKAAALPPTACAAAAAATPTAAGNAGPVPEGGAGGEREHSGHEDQARPLPLKLPPRLQQVPASFAAPDTPVMSPKTVIHGPYYVCAGGRSKPPKWARSASAAFRRTPSAAGALFSRTWSKPKAPAPSAGSDKNRGGDHERDAAGPDGPWCSPASSSSSSSVSTCFGGDDHGRGRPADAREVCSEEDDGSPRGLVRITRLRRNRSFPSMTTSNLWASIRRSVKQITPWS